MEKREKIKVKCHNCKHTWFTESKLKFVTCSNCQLKTKIIKNDPKNQS